MISSIPVHPLHHRFQFRKPFLASLPLLFPCGPDPALAFGPNGLDFPVQLIHPFLCGRTFIRHFPGMFFPEIIRLLIEDFLRGDFGFLQIRSAFVDSIRKP